MTALIPTGGRRSRRGYIWHRLAIMDPGSRITMTPEDVNAASIERAYGAIRAEAHRLFGGGRFKVYIVPGIRAVGVHRVKQ